MASPFPNPLGSDQREGGEREEKFPLILLPTVPDAGGGGVGTCRGARPSLVRRGLGRTTPRPSPGLTAERFRSLQRLPTVSSVQPPRQLLKISREGLVRPYGVDEETEAQQGTVTYQRLRRDLGLVV